MALGRTQVELDDMVLHVRYEVVQLLNFRGMGNAWPRQVVLVGWSAMGLLVRAGDWLVGGVSGVGRAVAGVGRGRPGRVGVSRGCGRGGLFGVVGGSDEAESSDAVEVECAGSELCPCSCLG